MEDETLEGSESRLMMVMSNTRRRQSRQAKKNAKKRKVGKQQAGQSRKSDNAEPQPSTSSGISRPDWLDMEMEVCVARDDDNPRLAAANYPLFSMIFRFYSIAILLVAGIIFSFFFLYTIIDSLAELYATPEQVRRFKQNLNPKKWISDS